VIGQFPWDPFPHDEPEPTGADPLLASVYRGAVEGSDAYRAVRSALRRDAGVLRVGNRFVPDGRYREVGFVALGHAASSMALAVLHVFGDRLTQGFVAGPEEPPASVPFRSETVPDGWGGDAAAPRVIEATREIATGLSASDLFLLLVSPGAIRSLLLPPPGLDRPAFAGFLGEVAAAGARGHEVNEVARVLGTGGVGGRLLPARLSADVQCLIVDRGDGAVDVGGGPTFPVSDAERRHVRATLDRIGRLAALPTTAVSALDRTSTEETLARRPVVVASPADAVREAGDTAFHKGWTARVGQLGLNAPAGPAAEEFVAKVEAVVAAERSGESSRTKGLMVFASTTLDLPEGAVERPACEAFLARARGALRRREMGIALLRTAGPIGPAPPFAGGAVGAGTDPAAGPVPDTVRPVRMRAGITDVGIVLVATLPAYASAPLRRGSP
jgi:glycerate-2-kinase